jgi:hypothetical protein
MSAWLERTKQGIRSGLPRAVCTQVSCVTSVWTEWGAAACGLQPWEHKTGTRSDAGPDKAWELSGRSASWSCQAVDVSADQDAVFAQWETRSLFTTPGPPL